jgi:hypothetical protein
MQNRDRLYLIGGRAAARPQPKIDAPVEFLRDRRTLPHPTHQPEAQDAVIALRKHVHTLLSDLAHEDLGSALIDLCVLRQALSEMSPEQCVALNLV